MTNKSRNEGNYPYASFRSRSSDVDGVMVQAPGGFDPGPWFLSLDSASKSALHHVY